ncbi:hypothetical protein Tco_1338551 [Tanacetum coccineum]
MSTRLNLPRFHLTTQTTPHKWVNTGYWQQPNPDDSPVEQVATSPTKKKKATRNRQKRVNQIEPAPRQNTWTTEKEIALAKGWGSVSENSERDNAGKKDGFWVEVLNNVMRMAQESGAGDEDYIQKAMIHYQAECGLPFKFRHCWEVLKDSPKFQEIAFPNFNQEDCSSYINVFRILLKIKECWFGEADSRLRQKGVYEESFLRHAAWIRGKLIQFMHTTMVPVQVKTLQIQAGVQVSRP